jgi:polar amino acid transport system substrate-binding protein
MTRRRRRSLAALALCAALVAGCSSSGDETMFAPATTQPPPTTATTAAPPVPQECDNDGTQLESYAPEGALPAPGRMPDGSHMRTIQDRGRLVVGVSADTLLFGARNPISGQIEGFDIDMLKQVAKAIFGDENAIEYRVITYAQRLPSLENGDVDIVAHTMTINCVRWQRIAFSTQYFDAGQRVLVRSDSQAEEVEQLGGSSICAADGSTNIDNIRAVEASPPIETVGVTDLTDCLVLFQQGRVDAVTGDDTVMAGFAAQDPYAKVIGRNFTAEPYGLGISLEHPEFVRFVNGVLERMRADGTWTGIYDRWLGDVFEQIPSPPPAAYGRQP